MIYCPYSNTEIPCSQSSLDHIVPLSLGGANEWRIRVSENLNNDLGSKIEGALANEFIFRTLRSEYEVRGQSRKVPEARFRAKDSDNRPIQVTFTKSGIQSYDMINMERRPVSQFTVSVSVALDIPLRFVAKVALGAGYFIYEDLFREHVDHHQLREVMLNDDPRKADVDKSRDSFGSGWFRLHGHRLWIEWPNDPGETTKNILKYVATFQGCAILMLVGRGFYRVYVGVLSRYVGMITVPAHTKSMTSDGSIGKMHVFCNDGAGSGDDSSVCS